MGTRHDPEAPARLGLPHATPTDRLPADAVVSPANAGSDATPVRRVERIQAKPLPAAASSPRCEIGPCIAPDLLVEQLLLEPFAAAASAS